MNLSRSNKDQLNTIPEILAPAGSLQALEAAVKAGCDAVYLGGSFFSARAFAGNFDENGLVEAIHYCHLFGVKVYMTVNTLLKDAELAQLEDYLRPYYLAGLDGVIVQDVGVIRVLKKAFPDLPIHGSTQMSISSVYGARFLKQLGVTRFVPARELSLEEIRSIRAQVEIEIEAFVHGAMCYAYSGKCLFSSFLGGRSGNRGRCAQPCRQCYEIMDKKQPHVKEYIMSLKDMCTLMILPQLIDAGIASFKIEGRMKNPYYVAATVAAYKKARDFYLQLKEHASGTNWENLPVSLQEQYQQLAQKLTEQMQDIYNRGGFHDGYYFTDKGIRMTANKRPNHLGLLLGEIVGIKGPEVQIRLCQDLHPQDVLEIVAAQVEITSNKEGKKGQVISLKGKELKKLKASMKVYRTRNNALLQEIEEQILRPEKQIQAQANIIARIKKPLQIQIKELTLDTLDLGAAVEILVQGNIVEAAANKPTAAASLIEKMQKTGGMNIHLTTVCEIDQDAFVPMSEFNNLRREAVEQYKQCVISQYERK